MLVPTELCNGHQTQLQRTPRNGQEPGADREPVEQIESQLGQSVASPGACPLRGGPVEVGLMSVAKL